MSLTSLKPSRKSVSRSNRRRSHAADFALLRAEPLVLEVEDRRRAGDDDDGQGKCRERQIRDVKPDEKDQDRALHREAEHIARLRQHRGIAGDGGNDARAADLFEFQKFRAPDHDP